MENQFTSARLKAAQSLKQHHQHPWSPRLRQAQHRVFYYKTWVSQYKNLQNFALNRQKLQLTNQEDPKNLREARQLLRQAQQHLKATINNADKIR